MKRVFVAFVVVLGAVAAAGGGAQLAGAGVPACVPAPSGILGWWTGDETYEDFVGAHDLTGSIGYDVAGEVGAAFSFNDPGSDLEASDDPAWAFGVGDFTIEAWIRVDVAGNAIVLGHDEGSGNVPKWFFGLYDGFLLFHINGPGGSHFMGTALSLGGSEWHHVAVTRTGGDTYTFYFDGAVLGSEVEAADVPDVSANLTVGHAEGIVFNGALDEVSIYDEAADDTTIAAIAAAGPSGKCKELLYVERVLVGARAGRVYGVVHVWGPSGLAGADVAVLVEITRPDGNVIGSGRLTTAKSKAKFKTGAVTGTTTFCVVQLSRANGSYNPNANLETCDSITLS